MKIQRNKKLHKTISFYTINFGFREPFQILIDATFCFAALKNKINIRDQLQQYFQSQLKLLTTPCCIIEAEKLGYKVSKAAWVVKQFPLHSCGHESKPISGAECFKLMVKKSKYIIATQDRDLQEYLRNRPGKPILYLHLTTPILEAPTAISKQFSQTNVKKQLHLNDFEANKLKHLKEKEGLNEKILKKKDKKQKNPNPLSCLRKKIKITETLKNDNSNLNNTLEIKKRKRVKIPNHVREIIKKSKTSIE